MAFPRKEIDLVGGVMVYLFAIVANLAAQLVIGIVAQGVGADASANDYFQLVSMLVLQAAFLSVPLLYCGVVKKVRPALASPLRKPHPSAALSLLVPVLTVAGFILPATLFSLGLEKLGYNSSADVQLNTPGKIALGILVMVIAAPFVEELIFRGFLLSGLRKAYSPYVAALLSAIAFSLMHMNPEQTVYQFFLGYACGLIVIESGNLWASVIVHAGSNLLVLAMVWTHLEDVLSLGMMALFGSAWLTVLVTAALAAGAGAAIFFLCRAIGKLTYGKQSVPEQSAEPPADGGVDNAPQPLSAPMAKSKRRTTMLIYAGGIGLCLLLWVFVLVVSLLPAAV